MKKLFLLAALMTTGSAMAGDCCDRNNCPAPCPTTTCCTEYRPACCTYTVPACTTTNCCR